MLEELSADATTLDIKYTRKYNLFVETSRNGAIHEKDNSNYNNDHTHCGNTALLSVVPIYI